MANKYRSEALNNEIITTMNKEHGKNTSHSDLEHASNNLIKRNYIELPSHILPLPIAILYDMG